MQVNIETSGVLKPLGSLEDRAIIIRTSYQPGNIYSCTNKKQRERKIGMNFEELSAKFNKLATDKKFGNGIYLKTIMLFYVYCKLPQDKRTVVNATEEMYRVFGMKRPNSASMSRNNSVLFELGLINLRNSSEDGREKYVTLTMLGEKYKQLF